ncbi:serine/threonine protein kinase [Candidatus Symbiothrix dinenymphae]|nr:serine/threonine protein kinase [Candidatus Symbiothrix dinenymphae]
MQLTENTIFADRYRLMRLLGRGGFSEVWLVEDTKLDGAQAALKIYAPGTGLDTDGTALFRQEFKLVSNLNHTNLLRPSHFDEYDNRPYLLMPFCEQGSAKKFVGNITEEQAWSFLHYVAAGLEYLHSQEPPIIHQDIKPDNILLNSKGVFLITDFGISTKARSTLRRSVSDNAGAGTLAYMGPERFGKDPLPIKAGDIWALGASMFELLTGDVPFGEHGGLIQKSGAEIPDIKASYSEDLKALVYKCLSEKTWDRPTAGDIVGMADKWFKGEKVDGAAKPKAKPEIERKTQRRDEMPTVPQQPVVAKHTEKKSNIGGWILSIAAIVLVIVLFPRKKETPAPILIEPEVEEVDVVYPAYSDEEFADYKQRAINMYKMARNRDPYYYPFALELCNKALEMREDAELRKIKRDCENK